MGGTALKHLGVESKRVTTPEFYKIYSELEIKINSLFPNSEFEYVKFYHSKETHGDMDILIKSVNLGNINDKLKTITNFISKNSNVYSFDYNGFQIDLIIVPETYWESREFYHYDPTGNLMGKLAHGLDLKLGDKGLQYVYRIKNAKHHIDLTQNFKRICEFLNLDYDVYKQGFNNPTEIFDWILKSKYFRLHSFLFENFNHMDRKRNRRRKTYNEFIEYVNNCNYLNDYKKLPSKQNIQFISNEFKDVNFKEQMDTLDLLHKQTLDLAEKFNGNLVMELTGLKERELGKFINEFRTKFNNDWILNNSKETIRNEILNLRK